MRPPPDDPTLRTQPPVLLAVTGRHASRWGTQPNPRARDVCRPSQRRTAAHGGVQPKMFTAREMTTATVMSDASDCSAMSSFAQPVSGIVSVGLNAVAFVNETYR